MKPAPTLREIKRGECSDEISLVDSAGHVTILRAHGLHLDERARVREQALKLLETVAVR
jgi:3,4-dihydroxy-2-butanone 4-phosphate synthase